MGFNINGIRTTEFRYSKEDIAILQKDWQEFSTKKHRYPKKKFNGRGIVFTAGGVGYLTCVFVSISLLRKKGCTLPIEVWYKGNEISSEAINQFQHLQVDFRDFNQIEKVILTGYSLKPLAIIYSSFKEVLFLDADNNCVTDPEFLFSINAFKEYGAVFWPDYWHTSKKNSIWSIIKNKEYDLPEQESGQILLDKEKCWKELQLCLHFNRLSKFYYKILLGDKDTFKFAWHALKSKFHMVQTGVGSAGYIHNDTFFGHTMVQHDTEGNILFLHRNLLKWDVTKRNEITWERIKTFSQFAENKNILITYAPLGGLGVDLRGDVSECSFREIFGDLEDSCMEYLNEWRESDFFKEYMLYTHFAKNRYPNGSSFSLV
jgi:alpha 1,2-mannosyltransferase